MRSLKLIGTAALIVLFAAPDLFAAGVVPADRAAKARRAAQIIDNDDHMDVNNLDMVVTNHGSIAYDLETGNGGLIYPRGSIKTAVFAAGLWIGAKVGPEIRTAVGVYSQEYVPGPMLGGTFQPDQASFKNFRIERGQSLSPSDSIEYIAQGGPVDSLGRPQLLGDATIWSVFNDADPGAHTDQAGSTNPLGIEVQQSVFAFDRSGPLGDIIFVKWVLINKGANTLDSTFVSVWSDPDLGGFTDDLVGCDTTLSLGYCYNSTNNDGIYGNAPPAVGYDFFKGPSVGGVPLGMTSFNKYVNGTDPSSQVETFNYMRGLNKDGTPIHVQNDPSLPITKYQVSGFNPGGANTASNWLDTNPGDRRLQLSSGPFTMAPGDTQEVVTAIIIGQGTNRLSSVLDMKFKDAAAQTAFDLNFDIPQPPPAPVVFAQELDRTIRLAWDRAALGTHSANPQQDFVFEGYRVWQLPSAGATGQARVIATFDRAGDLVGPIYTDIFNSEKGAVERTLVVNGTDEGLRFQFEITEDAIRGGRLVNYKDYYFAVTAFAYDSLNATPFVIGVNTLGTISEVLESALNVIRVVPHGSNALYTVNAQQVAGDVVGNQVTVQQFSPTIADSLYRLVIEPGGTFSIFNVTSGDTITTGQSDVLINGFTPVITLTTDPSMIYQHLGGSGLMGATDSLNMLASPAAVDSSGRYVFSNYIYYPDGPVDPTAFNFNDIVQHDYLIRVLPDTTEFAWDYTGGAASNQSNFKVPFEIYDLGQCSLDDPSDDAKVSVMVRDRGAANGRWDWGDAVYVRLIPYADVPWGTPGLVSSDYTADDAHSQTLGRFTLYPAPGSSATLPGVDGRFLVRGGALCAGDVFEFRTVPAGSAPGTVVKNDMKKIRAVPNPYYAHSQYELTQFDRVMKFTNIPASPNVTIRIFNLAGDLIRTIRRSAANGDNMSSSQIIWNLHTERGLPVASGIYVVRIDVEGVGSKTDRVAVFIEQERLDNF